MALSMRELPLFVQILLAAVVAVALIAAGVMVPGSPIHTLRQERADLLSQQKKLKEEVQPLEQVKAQEAQFRAEVIALQKQLETLKAIVPEEKEVDEFIRLVQGAAAGSGVDIRRMTAKAVRPQEYHAEMPFEIEVDGPYYSVLQFFSRLGQLSRIINVGDLGLSGLEEGKARKYLPRAGATVSGTFTAVTFFTKGPESAVADTAPGKQPGKR